MRELAVTVPADAVEDVLDELLPLAPHGVFEVARGDRVELRVRAQAATLPAREAVAAAAGAWGASLREREVPDDWHERRAFDHEPLVVAGRLAVRPDWAPAPPAAPLDVVLSDDGAFGAGNHPTTRACLELLCALPPGGAFADLGCGSGVLAIAAALLGWRPVVALDAEERALVATRANARRNRVEIEVRAADLRTHVPPQAATMVANVPPAVHAAIAARLERPPDALLVSGVLDEAADEVARVYAAAGLREARRDVSLGWATLLFTRSR